LTVPQYSYARLNQLQMFGVTTAWVAASVTAAGTTQATATLLAKQMNIVTTVPSGSGVIVPASPLNVPFQIANRGADTLLIYPPVGAQLETNAVNAPVSLAAGSAVHVVMVSETQGYAF
jgi:hypothetical protein